MDQLNNAKSHINQLTNEIYSLHDGKEIQNQSMQNIEIFYNRKLIITKYFKLLKAFYIQIIKSKSRLCMICKRWVSSTISRNIMHRFNIWKMATSSIAKKHFAIRSWRRMLSRKVCYRAFNKWILYFKTSQSNEKIQQYQINSRNHIENILTRQSLEYCMNTVCMDTLLLL
jgi:hypothetical protein